MRGSVLQTVVFYIMSPFCFFYLQKVLKSRCRQRNVWFLITCGDLAPSCVHLRVAAAHKMSIVARDQKVHQPSISLIKMYKLSPLIYLKIPLITKTMLCKKSEKLACCIRERDCLIVRSMYFPPQSSGIICC